MKKFKVRGLPVVDLSDDQITIDNLDMLLDYLTRNRFEHKSEILIISKEMLPAQTFAMNNNLSSELLQLCINYNIILIVVGDYSCEVNSQLSDFLYACNNGKHLFLVEDQNQGVELLKGIL